MVLTVVRQIARSRRPESSWLSSAALVSSTISMDIFGLSAITRLIAVVSSGTAPMMVPTDSRPPSPLMMPMISSRKCARSVWISRA
ncbi:hypothetical protein D3C85_1098670 [compost metagenome]